MTNANITIVGVHPVRTKPRLSSGEVEPVHIIEVEVTDGGKLDFGAITQEWPGKPKGQWQVAYDKKCLANGRYCFFFHFLDLLSPLLTPSGPMVLPVETPIPAHLSHIPYFEP